MFWANGSEHGPTIMVAKHWDSREYGRFVVECRHENEALMKSSSFDFESLDFELIPGKKYRITVEEIK